MKTACFDDIWLFDVIVGQVMDIGLRGPSSLTQESSSELWTTVND